jgi:hydrogenase small subunit
MDGWQEPTFAENLERAGVSRRDFLKYCGSIAAVFAAGSTVLGSAAQAHGAPTPGTVTAEDVANAFESVKKPNVVWLQLQECTGCIESVLRGGGTTVEDVVLNLLSVTYNECIMAPSGEAANKVLEDTIHEGGHILIVNGSVSRSDNGVYCVIGGKTSEEVLKESAEKAAAILAVGACAVYGGVQASKPNPTGACGVDDIIKSKAVINVAGCPPIAEVILATVAYFLTHGEAPKTDSQGRPLFAYDQRIHDSCHRRSHFDAGQFVRTFDDEGARNGWCLYHVGCKGPSTFSPCPIIQWNMHTSWPVGAGHPCIGCTEKNFFDVYTPFYSRLPNVPGFPVEGTAEKVGLGLMAATVAGIGIHAGATAIRKAAASKESHEEPLQAFGDEVTEPRRAATTDAADTATNESGKE